MTLTATTLAKAALEAQMLIRRPSDEAVPTPSADQSRCSKEHAMMAYGAPESSVSCVTRHDSPAMAALRE